MVGGRELIGQGKEGSAFAAFLRWSAVWFCIFIATVGVLAFLGFAPPEVSETAKYFVGSAIGENNSSAKSPIPAEAPAVIFSKEPDSTTATSTKEAGPIVPKVLPIRIIIPKIGVDMDVINPSTADTGVLDEALTHGVVRYPLSGSLSDISNIFIFGHSSYLPIVHNSAYRAFNNLSDLNLGDRIEIDSATRRYYYKVSKVEIVDASKELVNFETNERKLVLSTCDSFGKKTSRFVVEADFSEIGEI